MRNETLRTHCNICSIYASLYLHIYGYVRVLCLRGWRRMSSTAARDLEYIYLGQRKSGQMRDIQSISVCVCIYARNIYETQIECAENKNRKKNLLKKEVDGCAKARPCLFICMRGHCMLHMYTHSRSVCVYCDAWHVPYVLCERNPIFIKQRAKNDAYIYIYIVRLGPRIKPTAVISIYRKISSSRLICS